MDETSCVRNVYGELVLEPLQSPSSSSWQCPPWPPARGLLEPPGWSQQVQRAVPGAGGSPSLSGATSFHSAHNPSLLFLPDRCVLARSEAPPWGRHRIHQDPINLVSGFSADILPLNKSIPPGEPYLKKKMMKIEFHKEKVIKKGHGKKTNKSRIAKSKIALYSISSSIQKIYIIRDEWASFH